MTHRNHNLMLKNANQAIPDYDEQAVSISQIYRRQESPKLPVDELLELLERLIAAKDVVKVVEKNEANSRMVEVYRFVNDVA